MKPVPDDRRAALSALRVCRANGISPRVLVPEWTLDWLGNVDARGGVIRDADDIRESVASFAVRFVGAKYNVHASVWHAPDKFSCSSLVKYAFASVGIWMPRYAVDQSYAGPLVVRSEAGPGSLAFWKGEFPIRDPERNVGHVSLVLPKGRMLHASSKAHDVHAFTPLRPDSAFYVDPFPADTHALVLLPSEPRDLETALDAVRWLQR